MNKTQFLICLFSAFLVGCKKEAKVEPKGYPYVITHNLEVIDTTGVVFNGEIICSDENITFEYGFVWSDNSNPTLDDYKHSFEEANFNGDFQKHISFDLKKDVKYNVRAFVKTQSLTIYGNTISFTSEGASSPIIEEFTPNSGTDGVKISITGKNFSSKKENIKLKIGNAIAIIDSSNYNIIITKLPPNLNAGSYKISVEIDNKIAYSNNDFLVLSPIIESFSPREGLDSTMVEIIGKNFNKIPDNNIVLFGDVEAKIVKCSSDTLLVISPKTEFVGNVKISVNITGKIVSSYDTYKILGPNILNITPLAGSQNDVVNITGDYFSTISDNNKVYFGELAAQVISGTATNLQVTVPELYEGYKNVYIQVGYKKFVYPVQFMVNSPWSVASSYFCEARKDAVGFSIGDKGYFGTGRIDNYYSGPGNNVENYSDFWEYNANSDQWIRKPDFPGGKRYFALGFSIGNKGYLGTGYDDASRDSHNDFWEYDPSINVWSKKADFPGNPRRGAIGFSIGNKGYIGFGYHDMHGVWYNFEYDFWEYDPSSDAWVQVPSIENGVVNGVSFVANNKAYIVAGKELWQFDPADYSWKQKADYGGQECDGRVAFAVNNKGYVGTGELNTGNYTNEIWEYDPITDQWTRMQSHYKIYRMKAVGFSIGDAGFIGTGNIGGGSGTNPYKHLNDFWKFVPSENYK
jgi:N-acetylneuraminic acid mutarotase